MKYDIGEPGVLSGQLCGCSCARLLLLARIRALRLHGHAGSYRLLKHLLASLDQHLVELDRYYQNL